MRWQSGDIFLFFPRQLDLTFHADMSSPSADPKRAINCQFQQKDVHKYNELVNHLEDFEDYVC